MSAKLNVPSSLFDHFSINGENIISLTVLLNLILSMKLPMSPAATAKHIKQSLNLFLQKAGLLARKRIKECLVKWMKLKVALESWPNLEKMVTPWWATDLNPIIP
nr:hypothetical protein [Mycoplasmopsis bovis]